VAEQSARARPADIHINGPVNDVALEGMTPPVDTIQAFARDIAQMSEQALVRTNQHVENLRKAQTVEEAASTQSVFVKESLEHAVQHTRKFIQMLATFPAELVQPVNEAVEAAEEARKAAAASIKRFSEVARRT
jgi:Phasin protein